MPPFRRLPQRRKLLRWIPKPKQRPLQLCRAALTAARLLPVVVCCAALSRGSSATTKQLHVYDDARSSAVPLMTDSLALSQRPVGPECSCSIVRRDASLAAAIGVDERAHSKNSMHGSQPAATEQRSARTSENHRQSSRSQASGSALARQNTH